MAEAQKQTAKAAETVFEGSLLDQIVDEGRIAKEPAAKERGTREHAGKRQVFHGVPFRSAPVTQSSSTSTGGAAASAALTWVRMA